MNQELRKRAQLADIPLLDYILRRIKELEQETGVKRTVFAACPNSMAVVKAALKSARRNNAPIKFAATLNQVDIDGGYTGLTPKEFVKTIREEARLINLNVPVIVAIDHGGPWLKDLHARERWSYEETMNFVKKSFEAAVEAGYDLIHVDPTIDITLPRNTTIDINTVVDRTVELIEHTERFRRGKGLNRISYEVGTEEVHGGLADLNVFRSFLSLLKEGLRSRNLDDVWPCFVVGKVGTDLHTTTFDPEMAKMLTQIAAPTGCVIKGHYSDNVSNPGDYPLSGMGAANVGPEFTEHEYEGLMELDALEETLYNEGKLPKRIHMRKILWEAVIASNRWKKWLQPGESSDNFYMNSPERQNWLIKTGCRYIWENPEVVAFRDKLYANFKNHGIDAEFIVISRIEHSMDKYYTKFNLTDLNHLL
jgi:tagatose-1,6-bisphosphate aldolase non-catalytic subunit AgaZ/GatZ